MSQLKLSGDASGTGIVTVAAPNTNSTYTVTLPAAAGTIVTGAAGSDTQVQFNDSGSFGGDAGLTYNKTTNTLSTDVYVASAGTASAPSVTTTGDTNTGVYFPAADTAAITTGGTERMRIDSSGKVGIGVTPSAWTVTSVLQLSNGNVRSSGNTVAIGANWFFDGASKYIANDFASDNYHQDGDIIWRNAPSGTAGNSITWSERMRITSGGDVLVGTTSSGARFTVNGSTSDSTANSVSFRDSAGSALLYVRNDGRFVTGGSNSPYNATTSNAANCYIDSSGLFQRSTSSIKYKTQVENLEQAKADAILQLRPVWYRSLCQEDNQQWSWYGLIAEEVAVVEPRLVHWGYNQNDYEVVETDRFEDKTREVVLEDGTTATETYQEAVKEQRLKSDAVMSPEGVQYDRLTVLLLDVVKRQETRIAALEAKIDAQAARIAVLEAK